MTTLRSTLLLAAALAAPALPAAARSDLAPVRHVSTAGLDLTSSEGRAVVDRRIRNSARAVCDVGDDRLLTLRAAERRCEIAAVRTAGRQVAAIETRRSTQIAIVSPVPVAPR